MGNGMEGLNFSLGFGFFFLFLIFFNVLFSLQIVALRVSGKQMLSKMHCCIYLFFYFFLSWKF